MPVPEAYLGLVLVSCQSQGNPVLHRICSASAAGKASPPAMHAPLLRLLLLVRLLVVAVLLVLLHLMVSTWAAHSHA